MLSCEVWEGIDRLAFHENAILLDVKFRSQDAPIKTSAFDDSQFPTDSELTPQLVRNFLDDFSLVLSGHGGKDNVSAVCIETDEAFATFTLRVASNDGVNGTKLNDLEELLQQTMKKISTGDSTVELRREEVLRNILRQCSDRVLRHVRKFVNELKQARYPPDALLQSPKFSVQDDVNESADDIGEIGPYSSTTHGAYMQLCRKRLSRLRNSCTYLADATGPPNLHDMASVAAAAYEVRRSSSFSRYLKHNLLETRKPQAVQSKVKDLRERLGKISRFWRAATGFVSFGCVISTRNIAIKILHLPVSRHQVHELSQRTLAQLHSRGGHHFRSCNAMKLQHKLQQWPNYRLHCEMQLIVFYQENSDLILLSGYIGCDKLACYLCHTFITAHGQFQTKGCHQGLYSLWTVPPTISFENLAAASSFQNALRDLANGLEKR